MRQKLDPDITPDELIELRLREGLGDEAIWLEVVQRFRVPDSKRSHVGWLRRHLQIPCRGKAKTSPKSKKKA